MAYGKPIPLLFGRFLVKAGWVSEAAIQRAVKLQNELLPCPSMAAVLEGWLTVEEVRQLFAYQRETGQLFAEAVQELGLLTGEQCATLEEQRRKAKIPLGEALILQGSLSEAKLQEALAAFKHYKASGSLPSLSSSVGSNPPGDGEHDA